MTERGADVTWEDAAAYARTAAGREFIEHCRATTSTSFVVETCVNGHPLDDDNLKVDRSGRATCRICKREACQRSRARRRK